MSHRRICSSRESSVDVSCAMMEINPNCAVPLATKPEEVIRANMLKGSPHIVHSIARPRRAG